MSLFNTIQKISLHASNQNLNSDILIAKVISTDPIKLKIEDNMILEQEFLIITHTLMSKIYIDALVIIIRHNQKFLALDLVN